MVCLLRGKLWSFPTAIAVLVAFIGNEGYPFNTHFSWTLLGLTVLDVVVIMLIRHEYRYSRRWRRKLK